MKQNKKGTFESAKPRFVFLYQMFHYALICSLYSTYLSILQHAVFVFKESSQEKCPVFLIITTWSAHWGVNQQVHCEKQQRYSGVVWRISGLRTDHFRINAKMLFRKRRHQHRSFWCWSVFEPHNRQTAGNSAGTKRPSETPEENNSSSEINEFQTGLGRWLRTTTEASNDAIPRINRVKPRNAVRWWLSRKWNIDPRWAGVEIKQK